MSSLWTVSAAPGVPLEPLACDSTATVTIVGAGYTGLSAALHLSEAGREVVVLEAVEVGERASGLNGGQVIPGVKHDPDALEAIFGSARGSRLVNVVASGADLVFDLIRKYRIACAATRTGWIQPATSTEALQAVESRVSQWRRRGAAVDMLSREETARLTGSPRYLGGWIDRRGGTVQPLSYVRGLAAAAQQAGSRIHINSPVIRLERVAGQWRSETPRGTVTSAVVILATDAYTDRLIDPLRRSLIAVPSFQVATEPIPERLRREILPEGQAASDTWHLLRYFRLAPCGRLIMGSRGSFAAGPPEIIARHHYRAVDEIYPQLRGIRYHYHWGGLVAMTRDHLPHLHELAPGLLAGLGYNGRGIAMATLMGKVLAARVLGVAAAELDFPQTPLDPIPLHRFSQLGARIAVQGLRALDGFTRVRNRLLAPGTAP